MVIDIYASFEEEDKVEVFNTVNLIIGNSISLILHLTGLFKEPTCFKKDCVPSLVDVLLTNKKSSCFNTLNLATGVSDCHNLISTTEK